jgi:outer membrane protein assembly factor BamA
MHLQFKYGVVLLSLSFFLTSIRAQTFVFQHLKITGNAKTKPPVFLRELEYTFGDSVPNIDSFTQVWQKRISSLNLFNFVSVSTHADTLKVEVVERFYIWAKPMIQWADRNFNVWWQTKDPKRLIYGGTAYFNNLGGLNRQMYVTLIHGYNQQYEIGYNSAFNQHNGGWAIGAKALAWSNHELWYTALNDTLRFLHLEARKIQHNQLLEMAVRKRLNYFMRLEFTEGFSTLKIDTSVNTLEYIFNNNNRQKEVYQKTEFVWDTRDQKDYPNAGIMLRTGVKLSLFPNEVKSYLRSVFYLRYSVFTPLNNKKSFVLATSLSSSVITDRVPYRYARQLGYQADYVRGYEPYVGDGQGFVLGKMALRKALLNSHLLKFKLPNAINNYGQIPISLWFNIFVDAGKVLQPYNGTLNPISTYWYTGYGVGFDAIAWYTAMVRLEYSINRMGKGIFNVSFKNAF